MSRAEMAKLIIEAMGEMPTTPTTDPFPDVPKEHWAAGYIERLVQLGIVSGYGNGTYGPDQIATRAEMAKVINQAFLVA